MKDGGPALRDWFAGMAMSGMVSEGIYGDDHGNKRYDLEAEWAYTLADAMLAERNKDQPELKQEKPNEG